MVMPSTRLLHALPLPARILLPELPISATTNLHRTPQTHTLQPNSVTFGRIPGASFARPRWVRREVLCAPRNLRCSAMAGACADLPPMYRANVGICLINQKNQVFVAQRLDIPGTWQMPQGGIDGEEDPRAAALRELREETGVTSAEYLGEVPGWLTYDFPLDVKARLTTLWGKEWNGQAQKWFLFRFTGNDSEINLLGDGSENPEFSEWKWVPVEEVVKNAVEFKKRVYERAFKHLVKLMN